MVSFDSNFVCGNGKMLSCEKKEYGDFITFMAESKLMEPQPNWFYFKLSGLSGEKTRIKLANAEQCLDGKGVQKWADNHPVYRIPGGEWQRVSKLYCNLNRELCYDVSFDILFVSPSIEVAFCYPYSAETLMATLAECPNLKSTTIGYSYRQQPITRVYTSTGDEKRSKPGVYIIARQHSGETTGSWVIDGMLRYLNSKEGMTAREKAVWWFVPITDIDGVQYGCYGKDQYIGDFNRSWGFPFPNRVETHAIMHDIDHWDECCKGSLFLDMHAPSNEYRGNSFSLYTDTPNRLLAYLEKLNEHVNELLTKKGLETIFIEYKAGGTNTSAKTGVTSSKYMLSIKGIPGCTIEFSYQGPLAGGCYMITDYQKYGACLAQAIADILE